MTIKMIKATDLKPYMKIRTRELIWGARNFTVGEVSVRDDEVLFWIRTPTKTHRLSTKLTEEFEVVG